MTNVACLVAVLLATAGADEHLIAGARAFRAGQYDTALIEFRVADKLRPGGEAAWYSAATLQKLGRAEDAVESFAAAERAAPRAPHDALLDYYRAMACYDAKLYTCADRLLASLDGKAGPRIEEQARKARGYVAVLFRDAPADGTIAWYRARADEARAAGHEALEAAYQEEAAALSARSRRPGTRR